MLIYCTRGATIIASKVGIKYWLFIESKFVEVRQDSLEELSFKWAFRGQVDGGPKTIQSGNVDVDWKPDGIAEDGLISSLANATRSVSQTVGGNLGSVFNLDTIIGNNQFTTLIYMFDRKSGTDVLSTPKVTVQSGEEAYIAMTEERQFAESFEEPEIETTGDGDNAGIAFTPATPNFAEAKEDLGVTLTVTPTVMDDGISIVLELHPKVVEFIGYDETFNVVLQYPVSTNPITGEVETLDIPYIYSTPVFEVREIRTKVTVWDGESVVLGGTIKDKVNKVNDKIPYLGDIPLLGRLFRSEGEQSEKRNLVIFVTARIIDPSGIPIRTINNNGLVDFRR